MSTTRSSRSASRRTEAGTGLIATVAGVTAFLVLLLLAVQVTYDLYATSAVSAAAYDAARVVAGADGGAAKVGEAEAGARRALGAYASRATFTWTLDGEAVQLRVVAANPGFLPATLRRPLGIDTVDRTVRLRVERFR